MVAFIDDESEESTFCTSIWLSRVEECDISTSYEPNSISKL